MEYLSKGGWLTVVAHIILAVAALVAAVVIVAAVAIDAADL